MRVLQTEYLLKGLYLGLLLFAGLVVGSIEAVGPAREALVRINLGTLGGLAAALAVAALLRLREGFRVKGRLVAFILFLLLESPLLAYVGILGGTVAGLYLAYGPIAERAAESGEEAQKALEAPKGLFLYVLAGGAIAGVVFRYLRQLQNRILRVALSLGTAGLLAVLSLTALGIVEIQGLGRIKDYELLNRDGLATQLLLGIPFFYVLTYSGHEEETEVEM